MTSIYDIVNGDLATRLKQLMLFSRYRVEGRFMGENRSIKKGFSTDFMQHRQYYPGDNTKYLDWRVYARTGKFVIREYEETTNVDTYVIIDNSASMGYHDGEYGKHDYALKLSAILFYMMMVQKDSFGLSLVGEALTAHADTGTSRRHLMRLYEMLLTNKPGGPCGWENAMRLAQAKVKRKGLVLLISDFMDDPEKIGKGLSGFRSLGCDVVAFHLQHLREMDLDQTSMTRFVDIEDGTQETVDPMLIREAYKQEFEHHQLAIRKACTQRGIGHCPLVVGDDFDVALGTYLQGRAAMLM